jgi:hypothetical protein
MVRYSVSRTFDHVCGVKFALEAGNSELNLSEIEAITKVIRAIEKTMQKMEAELGYVPDENFPEFARRIQVASGTGWCWACSVRAISMQWARATMFELLHDLLRKQCSLADDAHRNDIGDPFWLGPTIPNEGINGASLLTLLFNLAPPFVYAAATQHRSTAIQRTQDIRGIDRKHAGCRALRRNGGGTEITRRWTDQLQPWARRGGEPARPRKACVRVLSRGETRIR